MTIPFIFPYYTVILANGEFPKHPVPLSFLKKALRIICCDGAADSLHEHGIEPDFIVGDLDSLSQELKIRNKHRLHHDDEQITNDLTKAVNFCVKRQWDEITILGATGKREDHSIGNISLLCDYAKYANIQLITDHGVFNPLLESARFESLIGQQTSIFSISPDTVFTFRGLKYPLYEQTISSWWQGTLNEASCHEFLIQMSQGGKALVFREHYSKLSDSLPMQ